MRVNNQDEFNEAMGRGVREFEVYDSAQVTAYGSAQVTAFGSAQVTAFDSSQVTAFGSAQVTAYDSAQVRAYGSAQVTATKFVAITKHGPMVKVTGGTVIEVPELESVHDWIDFYGVESDNGVVVLYKALNKDYVSPHGLVYRPGSTPVATDWDGGKRECGGGLHFSPRPFMALVYNDLAERFVACPVKIDDIAFYPNASMPDKVKAKGCCAPVWECDIDGNKIEQETNDADK